MPLKAFERVCTHFAGLYGLRKRRNGGLMMRRRRKEREEFWDGGKGREGCRSAPEYSELLRKSN